MGLSAVSENKKGSFVKQSMVILIFLLGSLGGYVFGLVWVWITDKFKKKSIVEGYHLHHSLACIPALFLALFAAPYLAIFLLGGSIGVIIQHTSKEGFKFITKK
jgi:hypothetical protein